jgi:hypothetical protein
VKCRPLLSGFTRGGHRQTRTRSLPTCELSGLTHSCCAAPLSLRAAGELASLMTSSPSAIVVAADHKVADPLRSAISSALASSLLTELSAIVVDYARTAYVDWDCEACLNPKIVPGAVAGQRLWTPSDQLEGPRMTVALPDTGRFVWLWSAALLPPRRCPALAASPLLTPAIWGCIWASAQRTAKNGFAAHAPM